jgi:hypothetical protein
LAPLTDHGRIAIRELLNEVVRIGFPRRFDCKPYTVKQVVLIQLQSGAQQGRRNGMETLHWRTRREPYILISSALAAGRP